MHMIAQHSIGDGVSSDVLRVTRHAIPGSAIARLDVPPHPETHMLGLRSAVVLLVALSGCGPGEGGRETPRTERERDSVLGASRLPGARGVRGALDASDSADARNARLDSVAQQP
jgi:hypothetical protein